MKTITLPWWAPVLAVIITISISAAAGYLKGVADTWPAAKVYTAQEIRMEIIDELASGRGSFSIQGIDGLEFFPRKADARKARAIGYRIAGSGDQHQEPRQ